ncbi:MAG: ATP-grasp domain-containing protein, partial [Candidatus Aenigmarchaeota archaeon]|nr:ATP-grasp domain-containing protein [Candidatus Aenigmarchaeota archaeon]
PETVSTDYDVCDSLYFEELTLERVLDIYEMESPQGIVVSMGGQTPNELSLPLGKRGAKIIGTAMESIDCCEDRQKFSKLCDSLGISQPKWSRLSNIREALAFSSSVEYPVIARPSYVLSGEAMRVIYNAGQLSEYLQKMPLEKSVVISKFIENAMEVELDGVSGKGDLWEHVITEHIENAGVHSGDATMVTPSQKLPESVKQDILDKSRKLAKALNISGPFNVQFLVKGGEVSVIECNLRASRSMPFVSKVIGSNIISLAIKSMLGMENCAVSSKRTAVGVKAPQFSFSRLKGADPILGVEMSSTGEVGCLGYDFNDALVKAMVSSGIPVPRKGVLLSISGEDRREEFLESARRLSGLGVDIFATEKTLAFLRRHGIAAKEVSGNLPSSLDLAICIPRSSSKEELERKYGIRRALADRNIPLITNFELAAALAESLSKTGEKDARIQPMEEY